MPSIEYIWQWTGTVLLIITCAWALWRGGAPERWGGTILAIGFGLTMLVQTQHLYRAGAIMDYVLVDAAALVAFVILSLWSRRIWTIFIAAFQLNAVVSHFVGRLSSHVDMYTLITGLGLWGGYGITFALMAGMWSVERKRHLSRI